MSVLSLSYRFLLRHSEYVSTGHYSLRNDEGYRIPVLYSTVGYLGIPDGGDPSGTQSLWSWSQGASTAWISAPSTISVQTAQP